MSTPLPPDKLELFHKLLAMIDSPNIPERNTAITLATKLLERHNMRWCEVRVIPQSPAPPKREPLRGTWRTTCHRLQERPGFLRPWERKFVTDLPHFARISTKQRYVLKEIADRVLGEVA